MIESIAVFATGVFFGAALYISVVQHPAALRAGVETAARLFVPMYPRAAAMQVSMIAIGTAASLWVWHGGGGPNWLWAAVLLGASFPFTLAAMLPTNRALLAPERDLRADTTEQLLRRWGRLHAVRSALSAAAFVVLLAKPL